MNEFEFEVNLITSITEKTLGLPSNSLKVKTKTEELVIGRMVVCNILMDGGVTPAKLAQYFLQDRTNYYHYRKQHKYYVTNPKAYPYYLDTFNQVINEYEQRSANICFQNTLKRLDVLDDIDSTIKNLKEQKLLLEQSLKTI